MSRTSRSDSSNTSSGGDGYRADQVSFALMSYDHAKLNKAALDIVQVAKGAGAETIGPMPMPNVRKKLCLNRSTHVYGSSKDRFERVTHKRVISIKRFYEASKILANFDLPTGVHVKPLSKKSVKTTQKKPVKKTAANHKEQ